jgi:hypothetical protein
VAPEELEVLLTVKKPLLRPPSTVPAHGPRSVAALPAWTPTVPHAPPVVADAPFSFQIEGFHRHLEAIPSLKSPPPVRVCVFVCVCVL